MLDFSDVSCLLGEHAVLSHLSLQIHDGELAVLLGPSGIGKTTLLRLAAGQIPPSSGTISNRFTRTAMVFQTPRLLPWLTVWENVALVFPHMPKRLRRAKARLWLGRLGLAPEYYEQSPTDLSGGQRQRVAIARAFAVQPDLILMDEPFSALDLGARRRLQTMTRRLAVQTGVTIVFVTHDVPEAVCLADRLLLLAGRPAQLVADIPYTPVVQPDAVWQAAAQLVRQREFNTLVHEKRQVRQG